MPCTFQEKKKKGENLSRDNKVHNVSVTFLIYIKMLVHLMSLISNSYIIFYYKIKRNCLCIGNIIKKTIASLMNIYNVSFNSRNYVIFLPKLCYNIVRFIFFQTDILSLLYICLLINQNF